jgi:hypothetical protein
MLGSGILDIAIGLVFVYLLLSLICTALQEAIATVLNQRGAQLFEGIKNLLNDPAFTGLAQQIYNHGLVDGISRAASDPTKPNRLPSYMPSATFSLALLDVLGARGVIAAAQGSLLTAAEQADDAYASAVRAASNTRLQAPGDKVANADLARKQAAAAVEQAAATAAQLADDAAAAAHANPADQQLMQKAAGAKDDAVAAAAAVKLLFARRAAIESATFPRDVDRMQVAATALEEALAAGRSIASKCPDPMSNLQTAVEQLPNGHTRESLLVLLDKTRRDAAAVERQIEAFQGNVEDWFNNAMGRVSGWYKRWTQQVLLALSLLVVLASNADTLKLAQRLADDAPLRAAIVGVAQETVRNAPQGPQADQGALVTNALSEARSLRLPFGWQQAPTWSAITFPAVAAKLMGLITTIFAVSLGVPFWFEMLNKIVNIRGTGTAPNDPRKNTSQK